MRAKITCANRTVRLEMVTSVVADEIEELINLGADPTASAWSIVLMLRDLGWLAVEVN